MKVELVYGPLQPFINIFATPLQRICWYYCIAYCRTVVVVVTDVVVVFQIVVVTDVVVVVVVFVVVVVTVVNVDIVVAVVFVFISFGPRNQTLRYGQY